MIMKFLMILSGLAWLYDWLILSGKRREGMKIFVDAQLEAGQKPDFDAIQEKLAPSLTIQFFQLVFAVTLLITLVNWIGIEPFLVITIILMGLAWWGAKIYYQRKKLKLVTGHFYDEFALEKTENTKKTLRSTFWILIAILLVRSFVIDPYRIPSGSLKPTLLIGDLIAVNKYAYGLRLPITHTKILSVAEPNIGDIVVFHWPVKPDMYFIKRLVGKPGDRIRYTNKKLYINGKLMPQKLIDYTVDTNADGTVWPVIKKQENLMNVKHDILIKPEDPPGNMKEIVVPKGYYFMMGDNRDDSNDSRFWGFVPEKNIVGKAFIVFMSWNGIKKWNVDGIYHSIRWNRIFKQIH